MRRRRNDQRGVEGTGRRASFRAGRGRKAPWTGPAPGPAARPTAPGGRPFPRARPRGGWRPPTSPCSTWRSAPSSRGPTSRPASTTAGSCSPRPSSTAATAAGRRPSPGATPTPGPAPWCSWATASCATSTPAAWPGTPSTWRSRATPRPACAGLRIGEDGARRGDRRRGQRPLLPPGPRGGRELPREPGAGAGGHAGAGGGGAAGRRAGPARLPQRGRAAPGRGAGGAVRRAAGLPLRRPPAPAGRRPGQPPARGPPRRPRAPLRRGARRLLGRGQRGGAHHHAAGPDRPAGAVAGRPRRAQPVARAAAATATPNATATSPTRLARLTAAGRRRGNIGLPVRWGPAPGRPGRGWPRSGQCPRDGIAAARRLLPARSVHVRRWLLRQRVLPPLPLPPAGDREPDQGVDHVLLAVPAGERLDDRVLAAGQAVRQQFQDRGRDALDRGVQLGRAGESGGLGAGHGLRSDGRPGAQPPTGLPLILTFVRRRPVTFHVATPCPETPPKAESDTCRPRSRRPAPRGRPRRRRGPTGTAGAARRRRGRRRPGTSGGGGGGPGGAARGLHPGPSPPPAP